MVRAENCIHFHLSKNPLPSPHKRKHTHAPFAVSFRGVGAVAGTAGRIVIALTCVAHVTFRNTQQLKIRFLFRRRVRW